MAITDEQRLLSIECWCGARFESIGPEPYAVEQAKEAGWQMHQHNAWLCPECADGIAEWDETLDHSDEDTKGI